MFRDKFSVQLRCKIALKCPDFKFLFVVHNFVSEFKVVYIFIILIVIKTNVPSHFLQGHRVCTLLHYYGLNKLHLLCLEFKLIGLTFNQQ